MSDTILYSKKKCSICLEEKSVGDYYKDKQLVDGLRTYCKVCWNKKSIKWTKDNQQHKNKLNKKWRKNNPDKVLRSKRKNHFKQSYGMTLEQVDEFKAKRNNKCDICGGSENNMVIDHCHTTDQVRGLLCNNCNRGIGLLKDSATNCLNASLYLRGIVK